MMMIMVMMMMLKYYASVKVIRERRKRREEGMAVSKGDLLGLSMVQRDEDGSEAMDDELLRAQVFTFMLAGHETTSVSLTWTLYELDKHPGRDPFNQKFRKFRSKTQWIGSVQPEKFRKTGPPFEVVLFSRSDRSEFWLNGSRPLRSLKRSDENLKG